jgi:hypothetical protein
MFDFKKLKLVDSVQRGDSTFAFVGIYHNQSSNQLEFRLPLGFTDFPKPDEQNYFVELKKLFFGMYKSLKIFTKLYNDKLKTQDNPITREDGVVESENGLEFKDDDEEAVLVYSKISMIDEILERFDEFAILSVFEQRNRTEQIDYSRIEKYLYKAVYLQDDLIYIDEMELPRKRLDYVSADIIEMFCFIYYEIKTELQELESLPTEVKFLSDSFKEKYLTGSSSLFDEKNFSHVISILKEVLNKINATTSYKSDDFWHFYEAIEKFLYSEARVTANNDGIIWGMKGFNRLWEDMCHTFVFNQKGEDKYDILYADSKKYSNRNIGGQEVYVSEEWGNSPFYFEFQQSANTKHRYLRPDLVFRPSFSWSQKAAEDFDRALNPKIEPLPNKNKINVVLELKEDRYRDTFEMFIGKMSKSAPDGYRKPATSRKRKVSFPEYPQDTYDELVENLKKKMELSLLQTHSAIPDITIADYKYMKAQDFIKSNNKAPQDVRRQIAYEYVVQTRMPNKKISSHFWIPRYFGSKETDYENMGDFVKAEELSELIREAGIRIYEVDFTKLQRFYGQISNNL